jgi:hypothetical protein
VLKQNGERRGKSFRGDIFVIWKKRHYTEKIIPKLISQDGTEQTNISDSMKCVI